MAAQELTINKRQAAYMLGVDERSLTSWQQRAEDPLPVKKAGRRGQSNEYDAREIVAWLVRQEIGKLTVGDDGQVINYEVERARLTKEQADAQALKNDIARRKVAPVPLLEWALANLAEQINSIFESIPLKIKNRVPGLKASEVEIIRREIVKAQNAASKTRLDYSRAEGGD